jgi:ArsR family transcriptional regulator, arsenate/arsenite/antimonite-responsive transcriptional repressor
VNEVFKALSDPTRRAILHELRRGARSAGELANLFPLSKSTLSGHFNVLKAADLVMTEKQGTTVIYRLNSSVFDDVLGYLMGLFNTGEQKLKEGKRENT